MKTILITGATSGIGYATALKLAQSQNWRMIVTGRRREKLEALQQKLTELQIENHGLIFDVRDKIQVENAIKNLPENWQNIDALLNNAGNAHGLSRIQDGDIDDWDAMIDGNVKGLLYVTKFVLPNMIAQQSGHIINISSIAGKTAYPLGNVYCASKAAVEYLSQTMRLDLTECGIKISNIAPGATDTEFSEVRFKGDTERAAQVYAGFEPLHAEDIADAIAYVLHAPAHVTIADMTLYPARQAAPTMVFRK